MRISGSTLRSNAVYHCNAASAGHSWQRAPRERKQSRWRHCFPQQRTSLTLNTQDVPIADDPSLSAVPTSRWQQIFFTQQCRLHSGQCILLVGLFITRTIQLFNFRFGTNTVTDIRFIGRRASSWRGISNRQLIAAAHNRFISWRWMRKRKTAASTCWRKVKGLQLIKPNIEFVTCALKATFCSCCF